LIAFLSLVRCFRTFIRFWCHSKAAFYRHSSDDKTLKLKGGEHED
jgi:hypothetical protein